MATPQVFVICGNNCKYEGMTKEQILTAIAQAVETGGIGNCDTGFITTIKTITGKPLQFFVGEQAEYDTLSAELKQNLFALITNDKTKEELLNAIETLKTQAEETEEKFTAMDEKIKKAHVWEACSKSYVDGKWHINFKIGTIITILTSLVNYGIGTTFTGRLYSYDSSGSSLEYAEGEHTYNCIVDGTWVFLGITEENASTKRYLIQRIE